MASIAESQALPSEPAFGSVPRYASMGPPGMSVPTAVVPNADVATRLGVDERWIESRTGVRERRRARSDESLSRAAAEAGRHALGRAGLSPADLDLILVATITADELVPNAAPVVGRELGAPQAGAMDVGAACTGFISGVAIGSAAIEAGRAEHVLVIGADFMSRYTDHDDRRTAGLLGDGAGAVTLSPGDGPSIGPIVLHTDPSGPELVYAKRSDSLLRMEGPETFRVAVDRMSDASIEAVERAGSSLSEVDVFVYHQANGRILKAVGERLGLDPARVVSCVGRFGNTSAASIPIALCAADAERSLRPGAKVLLGAIGAGFTYGACLLRWTHG